MIRNYITVAIRNLLRHRVYGLINLLGLSVGAACCLLAILYVHDELSYDTHHVLGDRTYRVMLDVGQDAQGAYRYTASTSGALAEALASTFPEIERTTRSFGGWAVRIRYQDKVFNETEELVGDGFFDVFTVPFLRGNPRTALTDPYTVRH